MFDVICPCCQTELKIDPDTRAVITLRLRTSRVNSPTSKSVWTG